MDPNLYRCAQYGILDIDLRQYDNQQHKQLAPDKSNLLHVSAQFHDSDEFVDEILNTQSSQVKRSMLTWKNSEGETALHIASRNRRSNIVQVLIEHAQDLDREELESGVKISEEVIRATDKNGDTALHVTVRNNHLQVAELLLRNDPHFKHPINNMKETPLYLAIERDCHDIVNSILTICTSQNYEGPDGRTALHAAIFSDCQECFTRILQKNPALTRQADESGMIPLHYAARSYFNHWVKVLLDADKSTAYLTSKDDNKTALHIAACTVNKMVMEELLNRCPDCWVMVTSKGQNILHLVVENKNKEKLEFILGKKWAINLINQKDAEGNTPLHLYVKGVSKYGVSNYFDGSCLLEYPLVDWNAVNKENFTPLDLLPTSGIPGQDLHEEMLSLYWKLRAAGAKRGARKLTSIDTDKRDWDEQKQETQRRLEEKKQRTDTRLKELRERAGTHLLVATLIATVTFAAGFTLPGGYDGNQGSNQGMAVLIKKASFKTFVVTDTIAVLSSISAVFFHFSATLYQDVDKLYRRHITALILIVISVMTMMIAFITGLYTVLQGSLALVITVWVMGCFAILSFCYMIQHDVRERLRETVIPSLEAFEVLKPRM